MKLAIEDYCIRCGICIAVYPDLYEMDYKGDEVRIKVDEVSESLMKRAKDSIRDCAVGAIHLKRKSRG